MASSYQVIDSDAHVLEPGDLWPRYMAQKFRDRAPVVTTLAGGREVFRVQAGYEVPVGTVVDDTRASFGGMGMRDGKMPEGNSYFDGRPGGFDPHRRIPDMNAEGIEAAFLYPSLGLLVGAIGDAELATAACVAYNCWLADYCGAYPDRLFGIAIVPMQSPEAAVAEIRRVRRDGFRAGYIRPQPTSGRPLHHPDNDAIWQAAQELDFAIAIHAAAAPVGSSLLAQDRFANYCVMHCATHTLEMMAAATSFIMCRICDRFPNLRVGFMEAGGGWMAGYIERMDRHFDDVSMNNTGLSARPSDIFRRQCFISFEPVERSLPLVADIVGRTNILWASDYPHSDGFVDAPGMLRGMGMPPDLLRDVLAAGAKRFYGLA
jgi:predicted TIM-barrel fold metal-dependent hydrolase